MAESLSFAELERRNRATARATTIWHAAIALHADHPDLPFLGCVATAEWEWADLHARCLAAEPSTDETEFAFGSGNSVGVPLAID